MKLPKYTQEFRQTCIQYALKSDESVEACAIRFKIPKGTLKHWLCEHRKKANTDTDWKRATPCCLNPYDAEKELQEMQEMLEEETKEKEYLLGVLERTLKFFSKAFAKRD
jgi:transposase-like protein